MKKSKREAIRLGKKHKQKSIGDLEKGVETRRGKAAAAARLVRFDFPPDATPEEIAEAIRKLAAEN